MARTLVVNADDFGASHGVNRGILDCHVDGIVTSASLMVTGRAVTDAVALSRENPGLSVGLHWDARGEDGRIVDLQDERAVRDEFRRQLDDFVRLLGRRPTHVDTHHHAHRKSDRQLMSLFSKLVEPLGVPLRDDGRIRFVGAFYAQVTNLEHVSVSFLEQLLAEEVGEGWTELSCHPGYVTPDFASTYLYEREEEVRSLTDPRARAAVQRLGIRLAGYDDWREEEAT